jgi:hypothetical protein
MTDPLRPGLEVPWVSGDGTHWLWFPVFGEWYGWMPGEAGLWCYPDEEFRRIYDAPAV